jgi:streptogrisin C
VTDYAGGLIGVIGTRPVVLASETICRSGRATGWQCGIAIADGVTAIVTDDAGRPLGTVNGLVRTTACANPSDSGGPVIGGQFALGIQSSRQLLCGQPGAFAFYQPLAKALADFGTLRLLTVATVDPPQPITPLIITAFVCESFGDYEYASFYCDLFWDGGTAPHQVSVSSNGSQARRFNDFANNHVSLSGLCDTYQDTYVSVSVFDSAGRRADANQNSFCPR